MTQSNHVAIDHFPDTKHIWKCQQPRANQGLPRIHCDPSDTRYTRLVDLVTGCSGLLSQTQGGNTLPKGMTSLVH